MKPSFQLGVVCSGSLVCLLWEPGLSVRPFSVAGLCSLSLYLVMDLLSVGSRGQVFSNGVFSVQGHFWWIK